MLASWEDGVSERVVIMGMSLETGRLLFWFQKEERDFSKVQLACWEDSKTFSQGKHYFHIAVFLTKSFCFSLEKWKVLTSDGNRLLDPALVGLGQSPCGENPDLETGRSWLGEEAAATAWWSSSCFSRSSMLWGNPKVSQKGFWKMLTVVTES